MPLRPRFFLYSLSVVICFIPSQHRILYSFCLLFSHFSVIFPPPLITTRTALPLCLLLCFSFFSFFNVCLWWTFPHQVLSSIFPFSSILILSFPLVPSSFSILFFSFFLVLQSAASSSSIFSLLSPFVSLPSFLFHHIFPSIPFAILLHWAFK